MVDARHDELENWEIRDGEAAAPMLQEFEENRIDVVGYHAREQLRIEKLFQYLRGFRASCSSKRFKVDLDRIGCVSRCL